MAVYRRAQVLLVDNERLMISALSRALRMHHQVTGLSSGKDALYLVESGGRFDAILCDVHMPEFTGMELFTRLTVSCMDQAARMIFMTGGPTTSEAGSFLDQMPAERVLYKPFEIEDALVAIERLKVPRGSASRRPTTSNVKTV